MAALAAAALLAACSGGAGAPNNSGGVTPQVQVPQQPQPGVRAADYLPYTMDAPTYPDFTPPDCDPGDYAQGGYAGYGFWSVTVGSTLGSLVDNGDGSATFTRTAAGTVTVKWMGSFITYSSDDPCTPHTTSPKEFWDVP